MLIILLLFILCSLLLVCYKYSNGILLTPQFGFVIGFIPQFFLACFYIKEWKLDISFTTFSVFFVGFMLFILSSYAFYKIFAYKAFSINVTKKNRSDNFVGNFHIIAIVFFQIITLVLSIKYLLSLAPGAGFFACVTYYRYTNLFSENYFVIPPYLRMLRTFCISSEYFFVYLLIRCIVYKDKSNKFLITTNIVLGILNDVLFGSRSGIAMLLVAFAVQYYFIRSSKYGWKNGFPLPIIFKFILIFVIFIVSFQLFAQIMGRASVNNYSFVDYIAGYLSAPIKNLDYFIAQNFHGYSVETNQTLNALIPMLSLLFDEPSWLHKLDLPFVIDNGYNFGNVYTIFYSFYYDMGIFGLFLYLPVMSFICMKLYILVLRNLNKSSISLSLIIYSYVYFTVTFSFFSNKFYESIINPKFMWMCLSWFVLKQFFRIKLNKSLKLRLLKI